MDKEKYEEELKCELYNIPWIGKGKIKMWMELENGTEIVFLDYTK